jgi:hypothetical protein
MVNFLVWKKVFKESVLVVLFPKHVNMAQQIKKCEEI